MKQLYRTGFLISTVALLALIGCEEATMSKPEAPRPSDLAHAMRWWNALHGEQRVAALYGTEVTNAQAGAAKREYGALDTETKSKVNAAAREIWGAGGHGSVGEWWQTLDCRRRRIAVGDGNTDDPASRYCADYPGTVS
ncbi:MAG: hypothetical protein OXC12_07290 [Spirochaetaceae bacterium]|nr:hypothetical protein [Spirochaetaceae bacterium]